MIRDNADRIALRALACIAACFALLAGYHAAYGAPVSLPIAVETRSTLADGLLGLMLKSERSPHSLELLPDCGASEEHPACNVGAPACPEPTILCAAPKFVDGAWRRVESPQARRARLQIVAQALVDESVELMLASKGKAWPGSSADLAAAMLAASRWSTGFREDIESGRKRGPAGEACLADLQPLVAWKFADFPHENLTAEQVALRMVGTDYDSLRRCWGAGLRALSAMRRWADKHCGRYVGTPSYAGFAAYATGNSCSTPRSGKLGDVAGKREKSFQRYRRELGL